LLELPAALVRDVRLVEPTSLAEGWLAAPADGVRFQQTIPEALAGGEIELIVDINLAPSVLQDGVPLTVSSDDIGSSVIRLLAVDGEQAQLIAEVVFEPERDGPLAFSIAADRAVPTVRAAVSGC
jgi:hypothetical protein